MANIIYITNTSLDGYIEDANGSFNWGDPDEIRPFITDLVRPFGTYLQGRRVYESMAYWKGPVESYPTELQDFAGVWQKIQKIAYSRTLTGTTVPNTRIERNFDAEAVRALKREAAQDIGIGGAGLTSVALAEGLVDECHLIVYPVVVGSGKPAFTAQVRADLELLDTRRFRCGAVHVHYRVRN